MRRIEVGCSIDRTDDIRFYVNAIDRMILGTAKERMSFLYSETRNFGSNAIRCRRMASTAQFIGLVENMKSGDTRPGMQCSVCRAACTRVSLANLWRWFVHHVGSAVARAACRLAVVPDLDAAGR